MDGHTTHVGRGARLFAESRHIVLFLFLLHLTQLLQPLDLSVFSPYQKGSENVFKNSSPVAEQRMCRPLSRFLSVLVLTCRHCLLRTW